MNGLLRRVLTIAGVIAVLYFAIQGGESGTTDLIANSRTRARTEHDIDSLRRIVDSLSRYRKRLETDPGLQERIAREQFGMVKSDNEMVYRFVPTDTDRHDTTHGRGSRTPP